MQRNDLIEFLDHLDLYLAAITYEFRAGSEQLQVRWIMRRCSWVEFQREHSMLWDIYNLVEKSYSAEFFDTNYYEELALRRRMLQELRDRESFGEEEWQQWLYITQNGTAIPVKESVYTAWIKDRAAEPTPVVAEFKMRPPEFANLRVRTADFHYKDPGGRVWQTAELCTVLANWSSPAVDIRVAHLKTLLMFYFDSPLECQLNRCQLREFCSSPCHLLGLKLWTRARRKRE